LHGSQFHEVRCDHELTYYSLQVLGLQKEEEEEEEQVDAKRDRTSCNFLLRTATSAAVLFFAFVFLCSMRVDMAVPVARVMPMAMPTTLVLSGRGWGTEWNPNDASLLPTRRLPSPISILEPVSNVARPNNADLSVGFTLPDGAFTSSFPLLSSPLSLSACQGKFHLLCGLG